ncbi:hypothetical protein I316_01970 [Kwoniella heveanensis BCC8398]|uniref:C2H2-type domain-containing protein n=1 Tax=Kwoniella heveanensis BCC8398 TaxID=1296120 RepID=A0A1B9GYI1_9TREE|nr:hypothetical protein I316_01970 [Kwoniella heveanensis BCC8398]
MIVLELLFLLVLFLADSGESIEPDGNSRRRCTCECKCGRKYYIPSSYTDHLAHGASARTSTGIAITSHQEVRPDRKYAYPVNAPASAALTKGRGGAGGSGGGGGGGDYLGRYVGGGIGEDDYWRGSQSQEVGGGRGNGWDSHSENSHKSSGESTNGHKDHYANYNYSERPLPPHLDRSVADWKSPHLTASGKRKYNVKQQQQEKEEVWCNPCAKRFGSTTALHQHRAVIHSAMTSSTGKHNLGHFNPEIDTSALVCEVCYEEFANSFAVRQHKKECHPWSLLCNPCLITFAHAQDARDHYELVHNSKPINVGRTQRMLDHLQYRKADPSAVFNPVLEPTTADADTWLEYSATGQGQRSLPADHVVKTYHIHTVSSHYECSECHMVLGDPRELAIHQNSPMAHGGANLTSDDFPPLGASPPTTFVTQASPDLSFSPSSDSQTSPNGHTPHSVWTTNVNMPSFSLKTKPEVHEAIEPRARLTPEPDTASSSGVSEDESINVTFDQDQEEEQVNAQNDGDESIETIKDVSPSALLGHQEDSNARSSGPVETETDEPDGIPEPAASVASTDPSDNLTSSWAVDHSTECKASETVVNAVGLSVTTSTYSTPEVPKVSQAIIPSTSTAIQGLQAAVSAGEMAMAVPAKDFVEIIPSHVKIPYARAALASASRLNDYPPREQADEDGAGSWGHDQGEQENQAQQSSQEKWTPPESIGGIDYQLPSFALGPTSPHPPAPTMPLTLDSSPYTEPESVSSDMFRTSIKPGSGDSDGIGSSIHTPLLLSLAAASDTDQTEDPDPWAGSQEVYEITVA